MKTSAVVFIFLGLAFNIAFGVADRAGWGIDFNEFYSSGRLAGTGHLYDWEALRKVEAENGSGVPSARLPIVALGYKIFARLPYRVARSLWLALSLAALGVFALLWPGMPRQWIFAALAWSMPATLVLLYGQDTAFWLMFFAAGLMLLEKDKPWAAGAAFALCICKYHLALGLPVMLVAQKRWKTLIGGGAAFALLLGTSFLVEGKDWVRAYIQTVHLPFFSPAPQRMPTLHGLAVRVPSPLAVEIVSAVLIVALLWRFCRNTADVGWAGAAVAACGLLLGHHAYANDCVLLIPLLTFAILRKGTPPWLKLWAAVLLSPAPVFLLVISQPLPGQLLVVGFVTSYLTVQAYSAKVVGRPFRPRTGFPAGPAG